MIRLADPGLGAEEIESVAEVLRSGLLVQGERVASFEASLASFTGAPHVRAVSSGTAALHLSLLALGVGAGDAVVVPAFTFPATANVVELVGARSVFVDVDPGTYCINPDALRAVVESWRGPERLKAVMPVHEFGAPCDMGAVSAVAEREGLRVVEDAACALGTRWRGRHVGTFGDVASFSWHPRKAITTGEGGAVCTADAALAEEISLLRSHGVERRGEDGWDVTRPGLNCRLTEFQAALGASQLHRFPATLEARSRLSQCYRNHLSGLDALRLPDDVPGHAWQTFMVVLSGGTSRARVIRELRARGVESGAGAQAVPMLTYYRSRYALSPEDFPVAAELFRQGLALPLHPRLVAGDVERVCAALREAVAS